MRVESLRALQKATEGEPTVGAAVMARAVGSNPLPEPMQTLSAIVRTRASCSLYERLASEGTAAFCIYLPRSSPSGFGSIRAYGFFR